MSDLVKHVNEDRLAAEVSTGTSLVDFWAPWCGPCRALAPVLDELAEEVGTQARILKVNVDENAGAATRFGVRTIPTLILFQDGKVVDRLVGGRPKAQLRSFLDRAR